MKLKNSLASLGLLALFATGASADVIAFEDYAPQESYKWIDNGASYTEAGYTLTTSGQGALVIAGSWKTPLPGNLTSFLQIESGGTLTLTAPGSFDFSSIYVGPQSELTVIGYDAAGGAVVASYITGVDYANEIVNMTGLSSVTFSVPVGSYANIDNIVLNASAKTETLPNLTSAPEPSSFLLIGLGIGAAGFVTRHRARS